jgi:excisionase family DNA binding protein
MSHLHERRDQTTGARMLRVREAADYLGVSVSYLNKLRCSGGGVAFSELGRAVVYNPADLEEWLAAQRRTSTGHEESAACDEEGSP